MIKYSIIVPIYNVEQYINRCVASLVSQNYDKEKYEIILVDDGSTDSSDIICDEYSDKYPFINVIHKGNEGLLLARGTGARHSKGQYIIFVDADDYIEVSLLAKIDGYLRQYDVDFLNYGLIREIDGRHEYHPIIRDGVKLLNRIEYLDLFAGSDNYNSVCTKAIRGDLLREHIDEIYSISTNITEDRLQTAYLLKYSNRILLVDECPYHYIIHDASIVHTVTEKDISDEIMTQNILNAVIEETVRDDRQGINKLNDIRMSCKGTSLNSVMNHIYKYNRRTDRSLERKADFLKQIYRGNEEFFRCENNRYSNIKFYNKIRIGMLGREKYNWLIYIDEMIGCLKRALGE